MRDRESQKKEILKALVNQPLLHSHILRKTSVTDKTAKIILGDLMKKGLVTSKRVRVTIEKNGYALTQKGVQATTLIFEYEKMLGENKNE